MKLKGKSKYTIDIYKEMINRFIKFIGDIETNQIYIDSCIEEYYKADTKAIKLADLLHKNVWIVRIIGLKS